MPTCGLEKLLYGNNSVIQYTVVNSWQFFRNVCNITASVPQKKCNVATTVLWWIICTVSHFKHIYIFIIRLCRWENNIQMDLKETWYEVVDWNHVVQNSVQWRALVNCRSCCLILAWFTLRPWRWRQYVPPKRRWTFIGLHGVTSQKLELLTVINFWVPLEAGNFLSSWATISSSKMAQLLGVG
jgi:hypothetical protein